MAEDKSLEDLEAELAALDAELRALKAGEPPLPREPRRSKLAIGRKKRDDVDPTAGALPAPAPAAPRLKLPFGRRAAPAAAAEPEVPSPFEAAPPPSQPVAEAEEDDWAPPEAAPIAPEGPPPDVGQWYREGGAWKRLADAPRRTYRRVLDADGNVVDETLVDEAPASPSPPPAGEATRPAESRARLGGFLGKMRKG